MTKNKSAMRLESPNAILKHIVELRRSWPQPGEKTMYEPAEKIEELWGAMTRLGWSVQPAPEMDFVSQLDSLWLSDSNESRTFRAKNWRQFYEALRIAESVVKEYQGQAATPSSALSSAAKAAEAASKVATTNLKPSEKKAYGQYKHAVEQNAELDGTRDRDVYDWVQENLIEDGEEIPEFDTWSRQLRSARAHNNDRKNERRSGRPQGRNFVRQDQI